MGGIEEIFYSSFTRVLYKLVSYKNRPVLLTEKLGFFFTPTVFIPKLKGEYLDILPHK